MIKSPNMWLVDDWLYLLTRYIQNHFNQSLSIVLRGDWGWTVSGQSCHTWNFNVFSFSRHQTLKLSRLRLMIKLPFVSTICCCGNDSAFVSDLSS